MSNKKSQERKVVNSRHVLAVPELKQEVDYYIEKLGFTDDFPVPGWAFLSFGEFKVMLGECPDDLPARDTGCHSWYAHTLLENVDEYYEEIKQRGATILTEIFDAPWGIREFTVETPHGHRIMFGQLTGDK